MPTIRTAVTATTPDALANIKFNVIPPQGAVLNLWCSGVTNGDTMGLSIGDRDIVVQGTEMNIEVAADSIDINRDQMVFNEVVGPGQLYMPVAVTTEAQFLIHIRYL
jgi:hypothetical protein